METSNIEDIEKFEEMGIPFDKVPLDIIDVYIREDKVHYFYVVDKEDKSFIILGLEANELPIVYEKSVFESLKKLW